MELNAGYLEDQILNQIACCSLGQTFPLWIYEKALISLKVTAINGSESARGVVRLVPDTEVIVAPKQRSSDKKPAANESPLPFDSRVIYPVFAAEEFNQVWLHPQDFRRLFWSEGLLVHVTNLAPPSPVTEAEEGEKSAYRPPTRMVVRASASAKVPLSHARLSWNVMMALALRPLSAVHFAPCTESPAERVSELKLFVSPRHKQFQWKDWAAARESAVICNGSAILLDDGADGMVLMEVHVKKPVQQQQQQTQQQPLEQQRANRGVFQALSNVADGIVSASQVVGGAGVLSRPPASAAAKEHYVDSVLEAGAFVLVSDLLKISSAPAVVVVSQPLRDVPNLALPEPSVSSLAAVGTLFDALVQHVDCCLVATKLTSYLPVGRGGFGALAIVSGGLGSGKSSVLGAVARHFAERLVYTETVDCLPLALERLSRVKSALSLAFTRCVLNQPSVLVLESLHALCPSVDDDDGGGGSTLRPAQISSFVASLLRSSCSPVCGVAVLASVPNLESLHGDLKEMHLCATKRSIAALSVEDRLAMIATLARRFEIPVEAEEALPLAARLTDGFAAGDLVQFLHRCSSLSVDNVTEARKHSTPSSVQGIKLHESTARWADVGGLDSVKAVLKQTLLWPTKYGRFFKSSPIKLPSGILLYGHTGTGKTLLANAAASECGMNFISVSGPELLSKYIGASEQAVRDVFRRATAAKPSVIVFDEFDSLAPRRGHDSTGVTDRVVNQLLTQLDGVESREGVYVIGVTSRPDLIDPALLRPGRLDKLLYVGIPSDDERLAILHSIAAKMKTVLAPDLDLNDLNSRCPNFTGADLSALMANAQLIAAHESLERAIRQKENDHGKGKEEMDEDDNKDVWMSKGDGRDVALGERAAILKTISLISSSSSKMQSRNSAAASRSTLDDESSSSSYRVDMSHLLRALSELKPSISDADRRKFDAIYRAFRGTHRDTDFRPGKDEGDLRQMLM